MSKTNIERISDVEALCIADTLLEAFRIVYHAIPMKLTTSIVGGRQVITRVFCSPDKSKISKTEEGVVSYKDSGEYHLDNLYELHWRNRKFEITLYSSPEDCGYYSVLPDYEEWAYIFCIIKEKYRSGYTKFEMCFGFDSEKKIILELFDIDFHSVNGIVFEAGDSVETSLQGKFIF